MGVPSTATRAQVLVLFLPQNGCVAPVGYSPSLSDLFPHLHHGRVWIQHGSFSTLRCENTLPGLVWVVFRFNLSLKTVRPYPSSPLPNLGNLGLGLACLGFVPSALET